MYTNGDSHTSQKFEAQFYNSLLCSRKIERIGIHKKSIGNTSHTKNTILQSC